MKKNFALILVLSFAFLYMVGCSGDDNDGTNPIGPGGGTAVQQISGTIENWNLGEGYKVFFIIDSENSATALDSFEIAADGSFSLNLPTVPSQYLYSFAEFNDDEYCSNNFTFSDQTFKMTDCALILNNAQGAAVGMLVNGFIQAENGESSTGDFNTILVYIDKPVSMSGTETCTEGSFTEYGNFSVSFAAGWNSLYRIRAGETDTTETYTYTTVSPGASNWYFFGFQ